MGLLDNILTALDHWGEWKQIRATPSKIVELEKRISELESKLRRAPGEACPKCGALEFRIQRSDTAQHPLHRTHRTHYWKCKECGYEDERTMKNV